MFEVMKTENLNHEDVKQARTLLPQLSALMEQLMQCEGSTLIFLSRDNSIPFECRFLLGFVGVIFLITHIRYKFVRGSNLVRR